MFCYNPKYLDPPENPTILFEGFCARFQDVAVNLKTRFFEVRVYKK